MHYDPQLRAAAVKLPRPNISRDFSLMSKMFLMLRAYPARRDHHQGGALEQARRGRDQVSGGGAQAAGGGDRQDITAVCLSLCVSRQRACLLAAPSSTHGQVYTAASLSCIAYHDCVDVFVLHAIPIRRVVLSGTNLSGGTAGLSVESWWTNN
jgi:hypothetical protein